MVFLTAACSITALNDSVDCIQAKIDDIISAPGRYDGREVCTSGYILTSEFATLHKKPFIGKLDYDEKIILLDFEKSRDIKKLFEVPNGYLVKIRGRISLDPICWTKPEEGYQNVCVLYKHPIDLTVHSISVVATD